MKVARSSFPPQQSLRGGGLYFRQEGKKIGAGVGTMLTVHYKWIKIRIICKLGFLLIKERKKNSSLHFVVDYFPITAHTVISCYCV